MVAPPVHPVHQVQVVLGVRVGDEGARRHVAVREHLARAQRVTL